MKYIVVLGDGVADELVESLGGRTPMDYANTPCMDVLASRGMMGMACTVPAGMAPDSDVANLAVMGYVPQKNYSGRYPLKALSIGVNMLPTDVIFRCNIPGANGGLHTNYEGKANAAVKALLEDGDDFVYIHVEAPDEMGHQGSVENKVQAIEYLDSRIVAPVVKAMEESGTDFRMLILPDHPTPVRLRTHTSQSMPYILYDSTRQQKKIARYTEREAAATGNYEPEGYRLMERFLSKDN